MVCEMLCVISDGVSGGECCSKVKRMILSCLRVLVTDERTDGHWWL